jgi:hypothetical protein
MIVSAPQIIDNLDHFEFVERQKRGLQNWITSDLDEPPILFNRGAVVEGYQKCLSMPASAESLQTLARYELVRGNYLAADLALCEAVQFGDVDRRLSCAHFSEEWFLNLPNAPMLSPITICSVPDRPAIFIGCDYKYYLKYALGLARSLTHYGCDWIHFHLMDVPTGADPDVVADKACKNWSLSIEVSPDLRCEGRYYYAAARLVALYQIASASGVQLVSLDADMWCNMPLGPIWEVLSDVDCALYRMPRRTFFHTQINASIVGINPSSLFFLKNVADYISSVLLDGDHPPWCLDQIALYCTLRYMQPKGLKAGAFPCIAENWFEGIFCPQKIAADSPYKSQWRVMSERWKDD